VEILVERNGIPSGDPECGRQVKQDEKRCPERLEKVRLPVPPAMVPVLVTAALRIVMAGEDRIDRRAQPHHAPPQIKRRDLERQDRVVGRNLCGGSARYRDIRMGHAAVI